MQENSAQTPDGAAPVNPSFSITEHIESAGVKVSDISERWGWAIAVGLMVTDIVFPLT